MKHLEGLQADLEASAHPAMDALSHHVTTVNLERVRRIKSRMNRMKVRDDATAGRPAQPTESGGASANRGPMGRGVAVGRQEQAGMQAAPQRDCPSRRRLSVSEALVHFDGDGPSRIDTRRRKRVIVRGSQSRVESVREILEKYLNDDDDMLEMYLSRKAVIDERVHVMLEEQKSSSSEDSKSERAAGEDEQGQVCDDLQPQPHPLPLLSSPPISSPRPPPPLPLPSVFSLRPPRPPAEAPQPQSRSPLPTPGAAPDKEQPAAQAPRGASDSDKSSTSSWSTSTRSRSSIKGEVEEGIVDEVEMLLEAYFMQVDLLFNKLSTLAEYIDDTEDYVNIKQDNQRNQLLVSGSWLGSLQENQRSQVLSGSSLGRPAGQHVEQRIPAYAQQRRLLTEASPQKPGRGTRSPQRPYSASRRRCWRSS